MDYKNLTDEQLVDAYQSQDEYAITELFNRYKSLIERKAEIDHKRNNAVHVDDFFSHYLHQFWKAANRFDGSRGVPFRNWFQIKLRTATANLIRDRLYKTSTTDDGRLIEKDNIYPEDITSYQMGSDPVDYEHRIKETSTDLFAFIKNNTRYGSTYAKVLLLLLYGYKYDEIAKLCGREGSDATLRNWTQRVVGKIRHLARVFCRVENI